jgi:F-type H+-transporting ATPase subunit b
MPQFDITTYGSQIFWFTICFALLYFFVSKIILPRISKIIQEREAVIHFDTSSAQSLENKLCELQIKINNLRQEANQGYQSKIEEITKKAAKEREIIISELKEKIDELTKKSRHELKVFIEKSAAKNESVIENMVHLVKEKIFGKELAAEFPKNQK